MQEMHLASLRRLCELRVLSANDGASSASGDQGDLKRNVATGSNDSHAKPDFLQEASPCEASTVKGSVPGLEPVGTGHHNLQVTPCATNDKALEAQTVLAQDFRLGWDDTDSSAAHLGAGEQNGPCLGGFPVRLPGSQSCGDSTLLSYGGLASEMGIPQSCADAVVSSAASVATPLCDGCQIEAAKQVRCEEKLLSNSQQSVTKHFNYSGPGSLNHSRSMAASALPDGLLQPERVASTVVGKCRSQMNVTCLRLTEVWLLQC
jgi:hypothetical protein